MSKALQKLIGLGTCSQLSAPSSRFSYKIQIFLVGQVPTGKHLEKPPSASHGHPQLSVGDCEREVTLDQARYNHDVSNIAI